MGTNCAPLVADLYLFCYERDFMMSLSDDNQADVIAALNTTSRYLDDILNISNVYFDNMVSQIYPSELQLYKANISDTEAAFLDLHLSISIDIVPTKIYDKHDDFDFEIVNFPFLDGDVPRSTSYQVYISQLICFARASSCVAAFNTRIRLLTQKLLKQGYRYHKLHKTFSKFYYPSTKSEGYSFGVVRASVRLSVHSVRPSVCTFCLSGTISQYLLVRFNSFLVQMISTIDSWYPISLVKIDPLTLE